MHTVSAVCIVLFCICNASAAYGPNIIHDTNTNTSMYHLKKLISAYEEACEECENLRSLIVSKIAYTGYSTIRV